MSENEMLKNLEGNTDIGSVEWFQRQAWKSLQQSPDGSWDFSDSSPLYSPASLIAYRETQHEETEYGRHVTAVEHEVLQHVAPEIVLSLPSHFAYIDLGPGTEHKERYFFDAVQKAGKTIEYYAVDISKTVLIESERFASERNIACHSIHDRFEDIVQTVETQIAKPRFVSLGATFANYEPNIAIPMTLQFAGEDGSVMITAQLRDRIDIDEVRRAYVSPQMIKLYEGKLALLGLFPEDIGGFRASDDIIVHARIKKPSRRLASLGMKPGDSMNVLKTYRWTHEQLKEALRDTQYSLHDAGKTFVVIHFQSKINKPNPPQ